MLKVLIISQNYPPETGAVNYIYNLSTGLAKKGYEITVVAGNPHYPNNFLYPGFKKFKTTYSVEEGVKLLRLPIIMGNNEQKFLRILGFISFMLNVLVRSFNFRKHDLIITTVPTFTSVFNGYFLSKFFRRQWIAILRDIEPLSILKVRNLESKRLFKRLLNMTMKLYRRTNQIVVIHSEQIKELLPYNLYHARISVINHCIDFEKFDERSKPKAFIPHAHPGNLKGIYVGTIGAVHQIEKLIELFGNEKIRDLPVEVFIYGNGEFLNSCKKKIVNQKITNVKLLGEIEWIKTASVLKQADFLILNVIEDKNLIPGFSSKLYDYFAAEKPILASRPSYAADLISELQTGWSFSISDPESLFISLQEILAKRDSLPEIGLRGRKFAEENFGIEAFLTKWDDVIFRTQRT